MQAIFFIQWDDPRFCGMISTNVVNYKSRYSPIDDDAPQG